MQNSREVFVGLLVLVAGVLVVGALAYNTGDFFEEDVSFSPPGVDAYCGQVEDYGVSDFEMYVCYDAIKNDIESLEQAKNVRYGYRTYDCSKYLCALQQLGNEYVDGSTTLLKRNTVEKKCARDVDLEDNTLAKQCIGMDFQYTPLRMFVTSRSVTIDEINTPQKADALCATDSNNPNSDKDFKALLAYPQRQVGGSDWVLDPFQSYYNLNGHYIGMTTGRAWFNFDYEYLDGQISISSDSAWSGFNQKGSISDNCAHWRDDGEDGIIAEVRSGRPFRDRYDESCDEEFPIICVEQSSDRKIIQYNIFADPTAEFNRVSAVISEELNAFNERHLAEVPLPSNQKTRDGLCHINTADATISCSSCTEEIFEIAVMPHPNPADAPPLIIELIKTEACSKEVAAHTPLTPEGYYLTQDVDSYRGDPYLDSILQEETQTLENPLDRTRFLEVDGHYIKYQCADVDTKCVDSSVEAELTEIQEEWLERVFETYIKVFLRQFFPFYNPSY